MTFKDSTVKLIVSESDFGAGTPGAGDGPMALISELKKIDIDFGTEFKIRIDQSRTSTELHPFCKHIEEIKNTSIALNNAVLETLKAEQLPLILTGDHSNAIGGVSGLKNAYPDKRIGVLWIDAHADLHSPYTTPSGNMHGMPLAALLGEDNLAFHNNRISEKESIAWNGLKQIGSSSKEPKIKASDIVFIGIRDAEEPEWGLIESHSICTFEPEDIRDHGIYYVLNKSIEHLAACDLIYVSFDADSLDPEISIGTGTTAPDGLKLIEGEAVFKTLMNLPNLGAFEITEINPNLDQDSRKMANVIASLIHFGIQG